MADLTARRDSLLDYLPGTAAALNEQEPQQ